MTTDRGETWQEAEALEDCQKFTTTDSTKLGHAPDPVPSSVPVLAFGAG